MTRYTAEREIPNNRPTCRTEQEINGEILAEARRIVETCTKPPAR